MAVPAIATLPGAPLVLPELTPSLAAPPPEVRRLRDAAASVVAKLAGAGLVVVCPSETPATWLEGDLGLGGFGTGDPPKPWHGDPLGAKLASRLDLEARSDDIPTEGRVVARLAGSGAVSVIVGLPIESPDIASALVVGAADESVALVAVGDLSASVGPDSPRPGHDLELDRLSVDGAIDQEVIGRVLAGPDAPVAAALQVLLVDGLPSLRGEAHVVRGVATLVASGI